MRATVASSNGKDDASVSEPQFCVMFVCCPFKGEDHFSCQIPLLFIDFSIHLQALGYFQKQGADGGRVEVRLALLGGHGGEIQKLNQ